MDAALHNHRLLSAPMAALLVLLGGCKAEAPAPPGPPPATAPATRAPATAPPVAPRSASPACTAELVAGVVRTAAGPTPIRVDPDIDDLRRVRLAVYAGGDDTVLVALRRDPHTPGGPSADGTLWSVPCLHPKDAAPFFQRAGADFGHATLAPDGWTLFFSDARGVAALDLEDRQATVLTHPEGAWDGCWVERAPLRDTVLAVSTDGRQLSFARGGPCGAESTWVARPWTLLDPLDPSARREREQRPLAALAAIPPATLWLSDGAGCDEPGIVAPHTRGALWRSDDQGATWLRVEVKADTDQLGAYAEALLVDPAHPDWIVAHAATCRVAELGRTGGEVFASEDRGATWRKAWPGQAQRVTALNTSLDTLVVAVADGRRFASRDLGRTWLDLDSRPASPPTGLAQAPAPVQLGETTFAAQDDGLYRRRGPGTPPLRVFPPTP